MLFSATPDLPTSGIGTKSFESDGLTSVHEARSLNAEGGRAIQGLFNLLNSSCRLADNASNSPEEAR